MKLSEYDGKYVRIKSIYGDTFSGLAEYDNRDFLEGEYGGNEDGIFIEDFLIYNSQIESIEEIEVHGTVEIWTEQLILRRYRPEDAGELFHYRGKDPDLPGCRKKARTPVRFQDRPWHTDKGNHR